VTDFNIAKSIEHAGYWVPLSEKVSLVLVWEEIMSSYGHKNKNLGISLGYGYLSGFTTHQW
jgi:hypothetical protein